MAVEDVDTEKSPGWWFKTLYPKLDERKVWPTGVQSSRLERFNLLWSYFSGNQPLPKWTEKHQKNTREYMGLSRQNYALLSVEVELNRQNLLGVRSAVDNDPGGDDEFRRLNKNTGFSIAVREAITFKKVMSEGYLLVGWSIEDDRPVVTAEDPRQMVAYVDPATGIVRAALKVYFDDLKDRDVAHVYTPGRVDVYEKAGKGGRPARSFLARQWNHIEDSSGEYPRGGAEKLVPVYRFVNRYGMGKFEPHLNVLDRISEQIADRMWISKVQAYRQRALEMDLAKSNGVDNLPDRDPLTGEEIDYEDLLAHGPDAVWRLPPGVKVWESETSDIQPMILAKKEDVKEFCDTTSTPMPSSTPDAAGGSAEGASFLREGLNFNVEYSIDCDSPNVIGAANDLFIMAGLGSRGDLSPIWAPVDRITVVGRADAAAKAAKSKVPAEIVDTEILQFTPDVAARAQLLRRREQLLSFDAGEQDPVEEGTEDEVDVAVG